MGIFEKNLEALSQRHPELIQLLTQSIETDHLQIRRAKSGAARLMVCQAGGQTIAIHNEEDPLAVARDTAKKISEDASGVTVLLGMGLGYLPQALLQHLDTGSALIVFEADPGIFKIALQEVDLTELFNSQRVKFLVGPQADLGSWCYYYMLWTGGTVRAVRYEPAFRMAPSLYEEKLQKDLPRSTQYARVNVATIESLGPRLTWNILEAVPEILFSQGVNQLENVFAGLPAILVAAGPSLEKNVQYLSQAKGRAVMIAADTALGYLLAHNIVPDFVVCVDPQEETYHKFQGVDIPSEVTLVYHPGCNTNMVKRFPGLKFVTGTTMGVYQWLHEFWPPKGSIEQEIQCQMHLGFNLAQQLGCDPIILVGQDLCYTDDRMHVRGGSYLTEEEETKHVTQGLPVKNLYGEEVRTYPVFLAYRDLWEKKFAKHSGTVINASEGGVPLEGAEASLLTDVIEEFCQGKIVHVPEILKSAIWQEPTPGLDQLIVEVQGCVRDIFRIERVSKRMGRIIDAIEERRKEDEHIDDETSRLTRKAERLSSLVPRYGKALGLIQMIDFDLELYMIKEETNATDSIDDPIERLDKQLDRGRHYYGKLVQAVPNLRDSLLRLQERLRCLQEFEAMKHVSLSQSECFDRIKKYESFELFDLAEKCFWASYPGKAEVFLVDPGMAVLAVRVLLERHQIREARDSAERAQRLFPDDQAIRAMCQEIAEMVQVRKKKITPVAFWTSPPTRNSLEAGNFYYKIKNFVKAGNHYRKAAQEENPENNELQGEAWYRLAKCLQFQGKDEEAIQCLERALLVRPTDSRIYFELGVLALETQALVVAERFFLKGAEISLDDPAYCEAVGAVLCAVGAHGRAIPFYERALLASPGHPDLLQHIAQAYQAVFEPSYSA